MQRLLFSLFLIIGGLICGYLIQQLAKKQKIRLPWSLEQTRKNLQKLGLLFFMPISFLGAIWIVQFETVKIALLPLIGVSALLLGGVGGLVVARIRKSSPARTGTLFCCGSFTNIGSIGALVSFIFLGEAGFALVAVYKMFEEIVYYTVGFPVARYFSGMEETAQSFGDRVKKILTDPFVRAALIALTIGLMLNFTGVPRPAFFETITSIFVPAGTVVLLVSIGLGMRFGSIKPNIVEGLLVSSVKFVVVPSIIISIAWLLGFHTIDNGLALKVVLINSSMPVAFTALVAASVYDLDLDLANTCWLVSTFGLLFSLPLISFLLTLL